MNIEKAPEIFNHYSVDEVAECVEGITSDTYNELWNALGEAEDAGKAKPPGGDGSDGTTEEPIYSEGEYDSDLAAAWTKLSEPARINIHEAAMAALKVAREYAD
jgi:hypothetical protein